MLTGTITPGTDMLARMACARLPSRITMRSPVPMSVATIEMGRGKCWINRSPRSAPTNSLMKSLILSPPTAPERNEVPSRLTPISRPGIVMSSNCLRRNFTSARSGSSMNMPVQSVRWMRSVIDAGERPDA
jgi:hypothetical protein